MASLVGVYAASHGPMIAREWDSLTPPTRASVEEGFGQVGKRLMASRADVLVIVSPDHWVNFFLNNFPAFCVGVGAEHDGPPEPFLKKHFHHPTLAGHSGLGNHIMNTAIERDFDPSLSHRLTLDHGFCLPLWRMGLDPIPPIVPIVVNEVDDPMPTMRRCVDATECTWMNCYMKRPCKANQVRTIDKLRSTNRFEYLYCWNIFISVVEQVRPRLRRNPLPVGLLRRVALGN